MPLKLTFGSRLALPLVLSALTGCSTIAEWTWYRDASTPEVTPASDAALDDVALSDLAPMDAADAGPEASSMDALVGPEGSGPDVTALGDGGELAVRDAAVDGLFACVRDEDCHTYFCGCGTCTAAAIECVSVDRPCSLGCPITECTLLTTMHCGCVAGSCVHVAPLEAGTGLGEGELCGGGRGECASTLRCCYPCGIPGCENVCTPPDPHTLNCPLVP